MMIRPDYRPHEGVIAPARHKSELWRFVLGIVVAMFCYLMFNRIFFRAVYDLWPADSAADYDMLLTGSTVASMYLLMFSFVFMTLATGIAVRAIHDRPMGSLLGPLGLALPQFARVSVAMIVLTAVVFVLPPWQMGGQLTLNMPPLRWLLLLPLSMLAVLVQVSAEEIVFRGYVQQQLAARFRSPLIWMVLPSAFFALGHYLPDSAGANALPIAIWAGVFGILMADLTARSGSLGPAIAFHFWNNVSAIVIVSLPDDLSGLALYLSPFGMGDTEALRAWLPVDFALMLVGWLAARLAIRR